MVTTTERTAAEHDISQLKADIAALKSDISSLTDSLRDEAGSRARQGYAKARRAGHNARKQAEKGVDAVEEQIEEYPFVSVLSAFGIGFVIGKLLDR